MSTTDHTMKNPDKSESPELPVFQLNMNPNTKPTHTDNYGSTDKADHVAITIEQTTDTMSPSQNDNHSSSALKNGTSESVPKPLSPKSDLQHGNNTNGNATKLLEWSDICFEVKVDAISEPTKTSTSSNSDPESNKTVQQKTLTRQILKSVHGSLLGGQVTALLGPSGSGKTSLLNILSGRQRWNNTGVAGGNGPGSSKTIVDKEKKAKIYYNGKKLLTKNGKSADSSDFLKKRTAFVLQDDALCPYQTVEECLMFSARLQISEQTVPDSDGNLNSDKFQSIAESQKSLSKLQKDTVESLIQMLGLNRCRHTIIGNQLQKGCSGGERKRCAIGVELISQPEILLLDEPTSGLDSFAAVKLIQYLKSIAIKRNMIVCLTCHQPGSEILECFDRIICLREGEVLLQGRIESGGEIEQLRNPDPINGRATTQIATGDMNMNSHTQDVGCGSFQINDNSNSNSNGKQYNIKLNKSKKQSLLLEEAKELVHQWVPGGKRIIEGVEGGAKVLNRVLSTEVQQNQNGTVVSQEAGTQSSKEESDLKGVIVEDSGTDNNIVNATVAAATVTTVDTQSLDTTDTKSGQTQTDSKVTTNSDDQGAQSSESLKSKASSKSSKSDLESEVARPVTTDTQTDLNKIEAPQSATSSHTESSVYNPPSILSFLREMKRECPTNYNPADWILLCAQTMSQEDAEDMIARTQSYCSSYQGLWGMMGVEQIQKGLKKGTDTSSGNHVITVTTQASTEKLSSDHFESAIVQAGSTSTSVKNQLQVQNFEISNTKDHVNDINTLFKPNRERANWFSQLFYLAHREFTNTIRNKKAMGARIGITIGQSSVYAFLFWNQALPLSKTADNGKPAVSQIPSSDFTNALQADFGCLVAILIGVMFQNSQPILLSFPNEKPIFNREFSSNLYSSTSYFLAKSLIEMPLALIQVSITFLITYFSVGFNASFFVLLGAGWGLGVCAASISIVISAVSSNGEQALQLSPLAFVPQIMFSGIFVPINSFPKVIRPLQYICPLKYAINIATISEFSSYGNDSSDNNNDIVNDHHDIDIHYWGKENWEIRNAFFKLRLNVEPTDGGLRDMVLLSILIMMCMFIVFRVMGWFFLWKKGGYLY